MMNATLKDVRELLVRENVPYAEIEHAWVYTWEERAEACGEGFNMCVKTLLVDTEIGFRLLVLRASLDVDWPATKETLNLERLSAASANELYDMTTLFPCAVPPLALPFRKYMDCSLLRNERILFSGGTPTHSFVIPVEHYLRVAKPSVVSFMTEAVAGQRGEI